MAATVLETYCARRSIPGARFKETLLTRSLNPLARRLRPVLRRVSPDFFALDEAYVECVGRVRTLHQLLDESYDFRNHEENRAFLRRALRLRVSVERLHDEVWGCFSTSSGRRRRDGERE